MKNFSNFFFLFLLFTNLLFGAQREGKYSSYTNKSSRPLIILDAGHGGNDHGTKIKSPHLEEKRLCLTLAKFVKKHLEQMGYRTAFTRAEDYFVPLPSRVLRANRFHADLFVSMHFNSCPSKNPNGIEIFYSGPISAKKSKESKKLADSILKDMIKRTSANSRGVKKRGFYVIRETKMPAVLIEGGFLTNANERNKIRQKNYLENMAKGIAEGIDRYLRSKGF